MLWSFFCSALEDAFGVVRKLCSKDQGERKRNWRETERNSFSSFESKILRLSPSLASLSFARLFILSALPERRLILSAPDQKQREVLALSAKNPEEEDADCSPPPQKKKEKTSRKLHLEKTKKMAGADSSEALDVARSQLAAELRDPASVGFDAETAAGVVEALFSGAMDGESVVEGLLGGDARAAQAVSKFLSAVETARGGAGAASPSSSAASTYQPASLSAEAAAARAKEEASRSAAAAVAAVSTGALAAVPAGARAGRALAFKEAKPRADKAAEAGGGVGGGVGGGGKQALGEKRILPAQRAWANCLSCGRIYSTRSADADTRRLLETGRCVFGGCGARVALRAGEVSDVRPAGRPPSSTFSSSSSESAAAAAFVDDLSRNPWLSSSERAAAISFAREAEGAAAGTAAAAGPPVEGEEDDGAAAAIKPALGPSRLLFSLRPPPRQRELEGKAGGAYPFEGREEEEKKQAIPGYYAPDEEASRATGKGKKRGG